MKKQYLFITLLSLLVIVQTSCKKYLDINANPNSATAATPELVLPLAITATASNQVGFINYGGRVGGYIANAGGFASFGQFITYNFTTGDYSGLWSSSYDNITDYKYVIDQTTGKGNQAFYNAIARIMRAFVFQKLVDTYNDIPYTDANRGTEVLNPKYDKADVIYQDLVNSLDLAIKTIADGQTANSATVGSVATVASSADPMFKGDMNKWKQFANTLKLRMLVRIGGSSLASFATGKFGSFDQSLIITDDALVNPGYTKNLSTQGASQQNPLWNTFGFSTTNTLANTSIIPTVFSYSFYNGTKLVDDARGGVIYHSFPGTPVNQLGNETDVPVAPTGNSAWYSGEASGSTQPAALGVLKGASAGMPLMLLSEAKFLLAEAYTRGYLSGNAQTVFQDGIKASFSYLYKNTGDVVDASEDPATDAATYLTDNSTSALVNWSLAVTTNQKLEAILTQKYIAGNMVAMDEAWFDFLRTGYPTIVNGSTNGTLTFASTRSISPRPDKLPTRVLYPASEFQLNPANIPAGINQFTSRIFWDAN